jgi:hypothetical protein
VRDVFRELKRVLPDDGVLIVNIGGDRHADAQRKAKSRLGCQETSGKGGGCSAPRQFARITGALRRSDANGWVALPQRSDLA